MNKELSSLREIVEKRQVCWDSYPERVRIRNSTKIVGYEPVLSGIHIRGATVPTPGCSLCREVFEDLKRVATWAIPKEERPSVHEISIYEPSIRYSRLRHHRPEVLSIKILHRQAFEAPIDGCEDRCLHEIQQRLNELGQGEWKPHPPSHAVGEGL